MERGKPPAAHPDRPAARVLDLLLDARVSNAVLCWPEGDGGVNALEVLGRLAPVERGGMGALAGEAQKWEARLLMPLFHPSPRVTNVRRPLDLQVNDMLVLRALVDRQVELRLGGTVAH
jgi:hypothetical protein